MNGSRKIPDCTRSRLLLYHRVLNEYSSREVLSSEELAAQLFAEFSALFASEVEAQRFVKKLVESYS